MENKITISPILLLIIVALVGGFIGMFVPAIALFGLVSLVIGVVGLVFFVLRIVIFSKENIFLKIFLFLILAPVIMYAFVMLFIVWLALYMEIF